MFRASGASGRGTWGFYPEQDMADNWFYAKAGQQVGPVSTADLRQKLATGEVQPTDLVWQDGMASWQAARTVPELAQGAAQPGYPQPQQPGYPQQQTYPQQPAYPQQAYPQQGQAPGYPPQGGYVAPTGYGTNQPSAALPVTSMVTGIISTVLCCAWYLSVPLGITALITGFIARGKIARGEARGSGMATAGLVLGIIGLLLGIMWMVGALFYGTELQDWARRQRGF